MKPECDECVEYARQQAPRRVEREALGMKMERDPSCLKCERIRTAEVEGETDEQ